MHRFPAWPPCGWRVSPSACCHWRWDHLLPRLRLTRRMNGIQTSSHSRHTTRRVTEEESTRRHPRNSPLRLHQSPSQGQRSHSSQGRQAAGLVFPRRRRKPWGPPHPRQELRRGDRAANQHKAPPKLLGGESSRRRKAGTGRAQVRGAAGVSSASLSAALNRDEGTAHTAALTPYPASPHPRGKMAAAGRLTPGEPQRRAELRSRWGARSSPRPSADAGAQAQGPSRTQGGCPPAGLPRRVPTPELSPAPALRGLPSEASLAARQNAGLPGGWRPTPGPRSPDATVGTRKALEVIAPPPGSFPREAVGAPRLRWGGARASGQRPTPAFPATSCGRDAFWEPHKGRGRWDRWDRRDRRLPGRGLDLRRRKSSSGEKQRPLKTPVVRWGAGRGGRGQRLGRGAI